MSKKVIDDFIKTFNQMNSDFKNGKINEKELFELNQYFHEQTGGRLNHYNMPSLASICVVHITDKKKNNIGLLGVRRGIAPQIGGIAFPGGYVDQFELPIEAASRELKEETGLVIDSINLRLIKEHKTIHNQILMFYESEKKIELDEAISAFDLFGDKVESDGILVINKQSQMCFSSHEEIKHRIFNNK